MTLTAAARQLCDRLRETVSRHARLCRGQDGPPEQTVLRIKQATMKAIAIARTKVDTIDLVEVQFLREQLVRWSVVAYFDTRMV